MAVSAVYAAISRVPMDGMASDSHIESNISATTAAFQLRGGRYGITAIGTAFGTLTLQVLGADGTTWLAAATALTANGTALLDIPGGSYRWALA
jgi:hypothetical protein